MGKTVSLQIPAVSISKKTNGLVRRIPHNHSNKTMHWAVKKKWNDAWKEVVGWQVNFQRRKFGKLPVSFAQITITFHAIHLFDRDGSYTAAKPLLDALKGIVIIDDSNKYVDLKVEQKKVSHRNEEAVFIDITF